MTEQKNSQDLPNVGGPDVDVKGVQPKAGQPLDGSQPTTDLREESASDKKYSLKKVDADDAVVSRLVTLEVVAEGTFVSSTGDTLSTGDRKVVNNVEAQSMLDAKVNGKPAFKEV